MFLGVLACVSVFAQYERETHAELRRTVLLDTHFHYESTKSHVEQKTKKLA